VTLECVPRVPYIEIPASCRILLVLHARGVPFLDLSHSCAIESFERSIECLYSFSQNSKRNLMVMLVLCKNAMYESLSPVFHV
jgi:hypothetical protein